MFSDMKSRLKHCRYPQLSTLQLPYPHSGEVSSILHYMIKFVSDLRQISGFFLGTPASSTSITDGQRIQYRKLKRRTALFEVYRRTLNKKER
jgi:hypothetical protein